MIQMFINISYGYAYYIPSAMMLVSSDTQPISISYRLCIYTYTEEKITNYQTIL